MTTHTRACCAHGRDCRNIESTLRVTLLQVAVHLLHASDKLIFIPLSVLDYTVCFRRTRLGPFGMFMYSCCLHRAARFVRNYSIANCI